VLFALDLDYLFATVKAGWADVVTQMVFARGRFNRRRRVAQKIMGAVHCHAWMGIFYSAELP